MSDRLATRCAEIRGDIDDARELAETDGQRSKLDDAASLMESIEADDRERNGPTPTDALIAHCENADECPNCGKPIDSGGWCTIQCMREDLGGGETSDV